MLPESDMDKLHLQKRLAGPCLSVKNVLTHENLIESTLRRWLQRLQKIADPPVDFGVELELLSEDLLSELAIAQPYVSLEKGHDDGHMKVMASVWNHWS
jgi:hypothetical protein